MNDQARRDRTKRSTLAAIMGLGFMGLACGTNEANVEPVTPDGLPLRTAEEQQVADEMEKNTLAEIDLPEGKMKFLEMAPGEVSIMRKIKVGMPVTRVAGERDMTLPQLFRAYAPGRDVPQALDAAMARVIQRESTATERSLEVAGGETLSPGESLEQKLDVSREETERVTSALASTVDQSWFINNFCYFQYTDWSWCHAVAWQDAYASRKTHRSEAVTCADTGAARMNFYQSGALRKTVDVPYGQCWTSGQYHGTHGFLGYNNESTQRYTIPYATGRVRFAGWNADNDQFVVIGSGWF